MKSVYGMSGIKENPLLQISRRSSSAAEGTRANPATNAKKTLKLTTDDFAVSPGIIYRPPPNNNNLHQSLANHQHGLLTFSFRSSKSSQKTILLDHTFSVFFKEKREARGKISIFVRLGTSTTTRSFVTWPMVGGRPPPRGSLIDHYQEATWLE